MGDSSIDKTNNTELIRTALEAITINEIILKNYNDKACRAFPNCRVNIEEFKFIFNSNNYFINPTRYLANLNSLIRRMHFIVSNVNSQYLDDIQNTLSILENLQYQLRGCPEIFAKSTANGIIGPKFR